MPIQKFAPMTKNFPTFDCDAHVTEPPWIWDQAKDWLTKEELEALKTTMWFDKGTKQLFVNGHANGGVGAQRIGGTPGVVNILSLAGPGLKHNIQRAINVRNLHPETAISQEQANYLDHKGSYEPKARLKDMDTQGIDQVMIIPSDIDTYPWLQNALGAKAMCKAYNEWAYEYCQEDPERIFFAALLPLQDPMFAVEELYRVAEKGCRVGLVRPIDAMGNYPIQPKYDAVWQAMEDTGVVYGMHPFPAFGSLKPPGYHAQYSSAELIARTVFSSGLPHQFLTNVQNFQSEAAVWVVMVLMSGFFEKFPKLNAAVFEASSTWLSFLLDECDKMYRLYRNERTLPPLKQLPSETFFQHCVTGFEGDEAPPSRLPEFYGDILAWSSDVYHHDGDDAWRAIEMMRACDLPDATQNKFLGENARKLYNIEAPKIFIRERVTEIVRPDWWPSAEEIERALKPEASIVQRSGEDGQVPNGQTSQGAGA
jgi:predicted TIM-barrel fold metal-dependent hydrolase